MDIFSPFLINYFNKVKYSSSFPKHLKLANITRVHKKYSQNDKKNNRPVSVLSNISKSFENILNQEISTYCENIFPNKKTAFHRGYNAQHCL